MSVSADQPTKAHVPPSDSNSLGGQTRDARAPVQGSTHLRRSVDQHLMQDRAPNSIAGTMREIRLHLILGVKEANAAKRRCLSGTYGNAQLAKCCQAVRHDALAAGFVDGRLCAVNDGDLKTRLSSCDGSRQSGGASAGNQHFSLTDGFGHCLYHRSSTSSEQKPGPMAARML